mmetsp:Transcript_4817/g.11857  ORF Transcript_4817/g.11857 Transcript_4817/m.11857 type:complete len:221 (+) Transcript_4817:582-1244(+)
MKRNPQDFIALRFDFLPEVASYHRQRHFREELHPLLRTRLTQHPATSVRVRLVLPERSDALLEEGEAAQPLLQVVPHAVEVLHRLHLAHFHQPLIVLPGLLRAQNRERVLEVQRVRLLQRVYPRAPYFHAILVVFNIILILLFLPTFWFYTSTTSLYYCFFRDRALLFVGLLLLDFHPAVEDREAGGVGNGVEIEVLLELVPPQRVQLLQCQIPGENLPR